MRRLIFATSVLTAFFSAHAQTSINSIDILGKWECSTSLAGVMHQSDTITLYRNNRFSTTGRFMVAINFTTLQPEAMAYTVNTNGTWSIKDGYFLTVDEEFQAENINPKIKNDELLERLKKTKKSGETESFSTKFIDNAIWVMESENEKQLTLCTRKRS